MLTYGISTLLKTKKAIKNLDDTVMIEIIKKII